MITAHVQGGKSKEETIKMRIAFKPVPTISVCHLSLSYTLPCFGSSPFDIPLKDFFFQNYVLLNSSYH